MADRTALPVLCPRCRHDAGDITFTLHTILAVTCARCAFTWATELADMPDVVRVAVRTAMLNLARPQSPPH